MHLGRRCTYKWCIYKELTVVVSFFLGLIDSKLLLKVLKMKMQTTWFQKVVIFYNNQIIKYYCNLYFKVTVIKNKNFKLHYYLIIIKS